MATHPLLSACVTLALLSACAVGRDAGTTLEAGPATVAAACTRCHGSGDDPAPPRSARGETSTTAIGVGAHQAHLKDGVLHRAIGCAECHVLPTDIQHVDGVAKVAFGPSANAAGVTSSWSHASATCTTYCHGATLTGGTLTTPLWTGGSSQAACGSCHGAPPPAPHPQTADCGICHQGYGRDFVNPVLHVDGKLQVSGDVAGACGSCHGIPPPAPHPASTQCGSCHPGYTSTSVVAATHLNGVIDVSQSCTSCHGDAGRTANPAAPPKDAKGNTATTARGVGAHQAHLSAALSPPVACAECHVVPTSPSHATGVAEVTFGPLARSGGAAAAWNGTSLTCTTYCHGATLNAGGTATSPVWTRVDGTQKSCTSCHGAPPPAPHAQSSDCGSCHAGYTATSVNAATHVNGVVDVAGLTCTSCHGDGTRAASPPAPPRDTKGNTATTARGVGAHQAHLGSRLLAAPVACAECHVVPTSPSHATGTVNVTFGALAKAGGAAASWNPTALTCATYCHGATLNAGGTATSPVWTRVDGTQKSCTSCHGAPPPAPHVQSSDCGSCHSGYTATTVNAATHLDGTLEVSALSCTTCHGDASRASGPKEAPPVDTKGNTATTARGVGAHQKHLTSGGITGAIACGECHVVPTSTTHSNGAVELTFGALARTAGAAPAWSGATLTCATTYCHGATLGGGTAKSPLWTKVDGSQTTCGSCHGAPPPAPHTTSTQCGSCHTGYTATSVNLTTHLNGTVDVSGLTCTSCHGTPPASGQHGRSNHVSRACSDCHGTGYSASSATVNAALHDNGVKNVGGAGSRINTWNAATRSCAPACHGTKTW